MFPSKSWTLLTAVGYGVVFSVAMRGGMHLACLLLGVTLSEHAAGNLSMVTSLLTGALCAYLYSCSRKGAFASTSERSC